MRKVKRQAEIQELRDEAITPTRIRLARDYYSDQVAIQYSKAE